MGIRPATYCEYETVIPLHSSLHMATRSAVIDRRVVASSQHSVEAVILALRCSSCMAAFKFDKILRRASATRGSEQLHKQSIEIDTHDPSLIILLFPGWLDANRDKHFLV